MVAILDGKKLTVEQLRQVYATRFPEIQLRDDEAGLIGVAMVHRATLVSSDAAMVIDQRSIPGTTSEHGEITKTLEALDQTYGRTKMLERVTVPHLDDPNGRRKPGMGRGQTADSHPAHRHRQRDRGGLGWRAVFRQLRVSG